MTRSVQIYQTCTLVQRSSSSPFAKAARYGHNTARATPITNRANKNGQSRMALTQESVVVATLVAIRFKRLQGAIWQLKQPLRSAKKKRQSNFLCFLGQRGK